MATRYAHDSRRPPYGPRLSGGPPLLPSSTHGCSTSPTWPAPAVMLQQPHDAGHNVATAARAMIAATPLGDNPARDPR